MGERCTITISAAGDVTLGNHQEQDYSYSFRQVYDQAEDEGYFFENVRDIFEADDMTIVNLEGPLTTSEQMREGQTYCIKGDPAYAHLLTLGDIEAVSFANNHRLDYGEQGSRDTVAALEQEGIVYAYDKNVGIYEIPDSAAAHGGERNLKIGIISVNEVEWGAQAEKLIQNNIEVLREQNVDLILACCHWGIEKTIIRKIISSSLAGNALTGVWIWSSVIIPMSCRESRNTRADILSTVWQISASEPTGIRRTRTP